MAASSSGPQDATKSRAGRIVRWRAWLRAFLAAAFSPDRRNILHWTSWGVALGIEGLLVILLWSGTVYAWEQDALRWLQDLPGHGLIFQVTSSLTNTLSPVFIGALVLLVVVLFVQGRRIASVLLLITFPLHVLAQFPKALVDRMRPGPEFPGIDGIGGTQSFPSGHAEYVITFYGFIAYLLVRRYRSRRAQSLMFASWLVLVMATGYGRMVAGRHWPLDVIGSYVIGLGLLSVMIWADRAAIRAIRRGTCENSFGSDSGGV
jgi:membrane-associated phospholipid phosphatase